MIENCDVLITIIMEESKTGKQISTRYSLWQALQSQFGAKDFHSEQIAYVYDKLDREVTDWVYDKPNNTNEVME